MIWGILLNVLLTIVEPIAALLGTFFNITGTDIILDKVSDYLDIVLVNGVNLLYPFLDFTFIGNLLKMVIIIETGIYTYKILIWTLKKIPIIGIE